MTEISRKVFVIKSMQFRRYKWSHIGFVRNDGKLQAYLDGKLKIRTYRDYFEDSGFWLPEEPNNEVYREYKLASHLALMDGEFTDDRDYVLRTVNSYLGAIKRDLIAPARNTVDSLFRSIKETL